MDKKLKQFAQHLVDIWKKFDKKKKILICSAAAAALIILVVLIVALNTTKYELLCSGLSSAEAGEVYNAVTSKNVPVKVSGTSIYVQAGTADTLRMELAEEGLPQGNLSYDIYSSGSNFAETDKDKEIKQLQQTQNRLQDTIETIPGVKQAIVNIAQSNDDTYVLETDKTPTTASVKLSLEPGTSLTKTQVNGVVSLVANSVSGLKSDNVTVEDSDGTQLNGGDTATDQTSEQLELKSKYESFIKSKLIKMLGPMYGQNNINVVVNADLDFSSKSTVTESYTSGTPNYETNTSEVTINGSSVTGGGAGVSGAQPNYANGVSGATNYDSKSTKTVSMVVGSVREQIEKKGGTLNNLSVAVVLNAYNAAAASADTATLKQTIAKAVGTKPDNISIQQAQFSSAVPSSSSPSSSPLSGNNLILFAIIGGAIVLVVTMSLLLIMLGQRKKKRAQEKLEAEQLAEQQAQEAEAAKNGARPGAKKPVAPIKSLEETLEESESNSIKKEIEDFSDKKPELVAQILKNWLKD